MCNCFNDIWSVCSSLSIWNTFTQSCQRIQCNEQCGIVAWQGDIFSIVKQFWASCIMIIAPWCQLLFAAMHIPLPRDKEFIIYPFLVERLMWSARLSRTQWYCQTSGRIVFWSASLGFRRMTSAYVISTWSWHGHQCEQLARHLLVV